MSRRVLPWLAFVTVFAGCVAESTPASSPSLTTAPPPQVNEEFGSVTGYALTDELRPVPRVRIALMEVQLITESDSEGAFTFNDVAPGTYTLLGEALGYKSTGSRVEVRAGEVVHRNITLQAIELPSEPYIRSHPGSVYLVFGASDIHRLAQTRGYSCDPCEVWIHITPNPSDALFEPEWTRTLSLPRIAETHTFYVKAQPTNGTIIATGSEVWSKKMVSREKAIFADEQTARLEKVNKTMVHVNTNPLETISIMQRVNFWFTLSYHAKLPEGYSAFPQ